MNMLVRRPVILQVLRFGAIGALNTALDFIILNYISKAFGIESGLNLGILNLLSFSAAIIQSYFWNRAWTFASAVGSPIQNFIRLMLVGGLGAAGFLAVVYGASQNANPTFYLIILIAFLIAEIVLWLSFGLSMSTGNINSHREFVVFVIISLVGLLINSGVVIIASNYITENAIHITNADTLKNVAKAFATIFSLIWNFLGYKLIVFKK